MVDAPVSDAGPFGGESSSLSSRTGCQKDVKQRWELVFSQVV